MVGGVCCFYLISAESPSLEVFWIFLIILFLFESVGPFNFFGLDKPEGFDRYTLLPLNGQMVLLSKNMTFVTLMSAQLIVMLALVTWRLGFSAALLSIGEAAALAFAYMAFGNWISVRHPNKMQVYRFSSGGPLPETIAGLVLGTLPGAVGLAFLIKAHPPITWMLGLILLIVMGTYGFSLVWCGKLFEHRREKIKQALS
jgi:hypothetical protein